MVAGLKHKYLLADGTAAPRTALRSRRKAGVLFCAICAPQRTTECLRDWFWYWLV